MNLLTRLLMRYEAWRQREEQRLVVDLMKLQLESVLMDRGVFVPIKEKDWKVAGAR